MGNRKHDGVHGKRSGAPESESKGGGTASDPRRSMNGSNRRPGSENRDRNGRPQQQQSRPQGQGQAQGHSQAAVIDPMEKSLRDINLRLKNAEREQENARKKFQEGGGKEGARESSRDGGRDGQRHQRGDRNDRGDRGGHSGRREFNRDRRPDRPRRDFESGSTPESESGSETFHEEARHFQQPEHQAAPTAPDIAVNDFGVSEDQLQHGRKFTAKRRQLPQEETGDTPESTGAASENTAPPEQTSETGEIQYGR